MPSGDKKINGTPSCSSFICRFIEYSQPFSYLNPFTGKSTQVPAIHLSGNDLVNNTLIVSQAPKSVSLHTIIQDALLRNNQSAAPNLTIMNEIYQSQFLNTTHKDANKIVCLLMDAEDSLDHGGGSCHHQ